MSLRWRRGAVAQPVLPPPGNPYGPTAGAAAVRSGSGARAVTNPGGGISFNSSGSLQSAINANPTGTLFVCTVTNPLWNSTVDTGTKAPTIIFPGTVGQIVIEGNNAQLFPIHLGNNATLKGGTWQNFGGASTIHGPRFSGDNSVIEDVVVSGMWDSGIAFASANGSRVSHCTMHSNGLSGYSGANTADNITMEYCNIYNNNTRGVNPGNEGGAGKIVQSIVGSFDHNWAHDNNGFGIWWDTACRDWVIEENVCENNARTGLFYEANDKGLIRRNYCVNNGNNAVIGGQSPSFENQVQLRVADSNCVTGRGSVEFNLLDYTLAQDGNRGGLLLLWDHTGTVARSCQNWDVHDNQFWLRGSVNQRVGGQDTAAGAFPVWANNSFFNNQYRVASLSNSYWKWDSGTGSGVSKTWAQWQAFHSGDIDRQVI